MKGLLKTLAVLFCLLFPAFLSAETSEDYKKFADSTEWLNLLRYEKAFFGLAQNKSSIKEKDFFFSSTGQTDPLAELIETLKAFSLPFEKFENIDQHPICRFPARFHWIKKNIISFKSTNDPKAMCPNYKKWRSNGQITSISIYFATGYFGNPASFFGHPLIKFNIGESDSPLDDTSLNYGANTPDQENPIIYVFKGLFGGYQASFTRQNFYYHNHNYSETEMRDLWDYKLNLDPHEIEYIVDFTWELLGKSHPYYFFLDNCAFRMGEILEHVFKKKLIFRNGLYVIPIDLFTRLANTQRLDGRPAVSSITRVPSRYSRMSEMYNSLNNDEKKVALSLINQPQFVNENEFTNLNSISQVKIIDTLINYYSFLKLKNPESQSYNEKRTNLIRERFKLTTDSPIEQTENLKMKPPHLAQKSFNLQIANVFDDQKISFQELNIRPALYDELNTAIGRPDNTSLVVLDTRLQLREQKVSLQNLDFFRVSTLNTPNTDLPEEGNLSWKVQMGFKSQTQSCQNCLVLHFSGGLGLTRSFIDGTSSYALIKSGIQNNKNNQGTLFWGTEIGTFIVPYSWWKILVSYEFENFHNGMESKYNIWKFENRFGESQNWDIRLGYHQRDTQQIRLGLNLYL